MNIPRSRKKHYDVLIIGAGLAGLSLARQLALTSDRTVLLVDKRAKIPSEKQKVGEATVQLSGYYFSRILEMEEYLMRNHYMKYNLRFYWKNAEGANDFLEDYSQAYIRNLSNIATFQLDRNTIEAELLKRNREHPGFTFYPSVMDLDVSLSQDGPHTAHFKRGRTAVTVTADWVVDTSGRGKYLERRLNLTRKNPVRHGASFFWVEGLVNIETLTGLSSTERRLHKDRRMLGHLPFWLATNHFMGEGFWFWVIPLHGKTSLGLVYDTHLFPRDRIETFEKLMDWICEEFPLFARDLRQRKVLDRGSYKDFSYDCEQTIHSSRWALSGESGRFTDPLYSPGSDFIAVHNTLICDAIRTEDPKQLAGKCHLYELLMQSLYSSLIPTFSVSYDALGLQASYILKYTWELSVYFTFFVFPFINDLFTDRRFIVAFLSRFSRLGPINRGLQSYFSHYYWWKKKQPSHDRMFYDFTALEPLRDAERMFYKVGLTVEEARTALDEQLESLTELARFIVAHIHADIVGDGRALTNRKFVDSIDLQALDFDPEAICAVYARFARTKARYVWSFDTCAVEPFRTPSEACDDRAHGSAGSKEAANE